MRLIVGKREREAGLLSVWVGKEMHAAPWRALLVGAQGTWLTLQALRPGCRINSP